MELTAAIEALSEIAEVPGPVAMHTDSTYVIKGISEWIFGWRRRGWKTAEGGDVLNRELWQALDALVSARGKGAIAWHYVRGHSGIPGNERVDAIADGLARGPTIPLYQGPLAGYSVADLRSAGRHLRARPPDLGARQVANPDSGAFLSEPGRRHADAARHVGRVRAARQGTLGRAVQEGDERRRRAGDPARVAGRSRIAVIGARRPPYWQYVPV